MNALIKSTLRLEQALDLSPMSRKKQTREATHAELKKHMRDLCAYLERCGMDETANEYMCRSFGDPADSDRDGFGDEYAP